MYIPKHFRIDEDREAIDFIKKYSFGTLVTIENDLPIATHVPFIVSHKEDKFILTSHIALANPQSKTLTANPVLVIFSEPHAYISPSNYEKELNVPTWNYLAVHAYGNAEIITDMEAKLAALHHMITFYNDEVYLAQWKTMPMDYKVKMANGIVAFDILVTDLQGKKKLSQNRSASEKQNIISSLEKSKDTTVSAVADYMRKEL